MDSPIFFSISPKSRKNIGGQGNYRIFYFHIFFIFYFLSFSLYLLIARPGFRQRIELK